MRYTINIQHIPGSYFPSAQCRKVAQYANQARKLHKSLPRSRTHVRASLSSVRPFKNEHTIYPWSVARSFYHASDSDGSSGKPPGTDSPVTGAAKALQPPDVDEYENLSYARLSDPRTIVKHLNEYVIGQERAKKTLAVAVYNHYTRVRANLLAQRMNQEDHTSDSVETQPHHNPERSWAQQEVYPAATKAPGGAGSMVTRRRAWSETKAGSDDNTVYEKSNVLLVGPTGSGKTLLAKTIAQLLQVPFSMSDATPFTQAGYVGEDVELVIQRLLQACDHDVKKAETGIVFIDEIDKISRRTDASSSRDVSGEGVQQSLLRMLEGTIVNVTDKSATTNQGQNRRGGNYSANTPPNKPETFAVDTSNILFIVSGAFIGLEKTVMDRISKGSIGFGASLRASHEKSDYSSVENPLDLVEPQDLTMYGLIPEFIGRLPVIAPLNSLSVNDLVRILTEPKNSLVKQYQGLFALNDVKLDFSQTALQRVAEEALEKKTGARGLRRIMENLLLDPMYDTPNTHIKQVVIDSKVVNKEKPAIYLGAGQSQLVEKIIAEDDGLLSVDSRLSPLEQEETVRRQVTQM